MNVDDFAEIEAKLDRILELLEHRREHDRPRGYSLADQFNDLIQRHEKLLISDAKFYEILADITGISLPEVVEVTTMADAEPVFIPVTEGDQHKH